MTRITRTPPRAGAAGRAPAEDGAPGRQALPFAGRLALVTGGARRVGREIALRLGSLGADVVVHYRRSGAGARATRDELLAMGRQAWAVRGDLSSPASAAALLRAAEAAGPLDFLVNSASSFPRDTLADATPARLRAALDTNALAPFALGRAFAGRGRPGAVVNVLDANVLRRDAPHFSYHLSKRLLLDLTMQMALAFAPAVRVNAVAPGFVLPADGAEAADTAARATDNPLALRGSPGDVAGAVAYLLAARFVTGQVIWVDGGAHLRGSPYAAW